MTNGEILRVPEGQYIFPYGGGRCAAGTHLILLFETYSYASLYPSWYCILPDGTIDRIVFEIVLFRAQ